MVFVDNIIVIIINFSREHKFLSYFHVLGPQKCQKRDNMIQIGRSKPQNLGVSQNQVAVVAIGKFLGKGGG